MRPAPCGAPAPAGPGAVRRVSPGCSCGRLLLLDLALAVGRDVLSRVPGEGEEDLVEAGLAEGEVRDRDSPARELTDDLGRLVGAPARRGERRRIGLEVNLATEGASDDRLGDRPLFGIQEADAKGSGTD